MGTKKSKADVQIQEEKPVKKSQIQHLQDELSRLRGELKDAHRKEYVVDSLAGLMKELITPIKALPKYPELKRKAKHTEHLVMHISDQHLDEVVIPEHVRGLEKYDFQVAAARAEMYVDKVINFSQVTMSNYDFPVLWMLFYGDHVSGEIHDAEKDSYFGNMFKNSLAAGQLNSLMIRDLAPYFDQINVVCVPGNHGRRTPKKDYKHPQNNWDYMVFKLMEQQCKDLKGVDFLIPDCFSVKLDINGSGFVVSHGDEIRAWGGLPLYGISRKVGGVLSLAHKQKDFNLRYVVYGHFHQSAEMSQNHIGVLLNGSWLRTSDFAFNAVNGFAEPYQILHGVHADHGISWRMNVRLTGREGAEESPKRYKITV